MTDQANVCCVKCRVKFPLRPGTQHQVLDVVGEGAYGIVCSAVHRPSTHKVPIKKIAPVDYSCFTCGRQELKLLKFLSEAGMSENVSVATDPIAVALTLLYRSSPC